MRSLRSALSMLFAALLITFGAFDISEAANPVGTVYTMSNSPAGNEVLIHRRRADGTLEFSSGVATGGRGTGGGLGNQGGLLLSKDNAWLVAVNAGSNDVSVFAVGKDGLHLTDRERSDGEQPISVTMQGDVLYVLNAGSDSVSGFVLSREGRLHKLFGSKRPLSAAGAGAAQVEFSTDGRTLVVTEKATNTLRTFPVFFGSVLGRGQNTAASGRTPFGFAFGRRGQLFVSQAEGGQSGLSTLAAYQLDRTSTVTALGAPQPTNQTAACWVAITLDNRYAYTTNTGSDTISGFALTSGGAIRPLTESSVVASVAAGGAPIDMGISDDSRFLYVLNGGTRSIDAFRIGAGGQLTSLGTIDGLPAGVNGLAVR